ncbi:MAG: amidohydrolase/deacetylase family metallohydrolase [Chloroflexota bacterium]|nr:MAG: amidohydrolase/deacetylase family metallohydrolase [Chloroflexota bacterium]
MQFDSLIAGGDVIDPGAGHIGRLDVGITNGKIAAVAPSLPRENARHVIDATGLIVTPGLVDLHTHVYWGATYWGIEPDPIAARTGVTTWLDVGSAGAYSFPGFRAWIAEPSRARVYSLLNASYVGLVGPTYEFANLDYANVALAERVTNDNRDLILGIKARIDASTTRSTGIEPLRRARDLADRVQLPLMVHIGKGPPELREILDLMRPGDILTHCFTGHDNRVIDAGQMVLPFVREIWDRGLIMDIGHGAGSFSVETARAMLSQGLRPDVISTDIHQLSVQGPMFDMPTTMSKFLALGMSLVDVVERATSRPARAVGLKDIGTLRPGNPADVALFRVREGCFTYYDVFLNPFQGTKQLDCALTLVDGLALVPGPQRPLQHWADNPDLRAKVGPRP